MVAALVDAAPRTIPELMSFALSRRTSLQALARDIGVSKQTVKRWIDGDSLPSAKHSEQIATALRMEYLDVLRMAGHPVPVEHTPSDDPPWLAKLIAEMRDMKLTRYEVDLMDATREGLRRFREDRAAYDAGPPGPASPE